MLVCLDAEEWHVHCLNLWKGEQGFRPSGVTMPFGVELHVQEE